MTYATTTYGGTTYGDTTPEAADRIRVTVRERSMMLARTRTSQPSLARTRDLTSDP
jgi:hypothetical protein